MTTKDPAAPLAHAEVSRRGGQASARNVTEKRREASRKNGARVVSINAVAALYQRFRDVAPEAAENALAELFNESQRAQIAPGRGSE